MRGYAARPPDGWLAESHGVFVFGVDRSGGRTTADDGLGAGPAEIAEGRREDGAGEPSQAEEEAQEEEVRWRCPPSGGWESRGW